MTKRAAATQEARIRGMLAEKEIRITEQRVAILRALATRRAPTSFPELVLHMAKKDLDRATVYRNLLGLTDAGILIMTKLGDGVARYELPQSGESAHAEHLHLVCVDCGNVSCLPANAVSVRGEVARRVTEVQLRGHCTACSRA